MWRIWNVWWNLTKVYLLLILFFITPCFARLFAFSVQGHDQRREFCVDTPIKVISINQIDATNLHRCWYRSKLTSWLEKYAVLCGVWNVTRGAISWLEWLGWKARVWLKTNEIKCYHSLSVWESIPLAVIEVGKSRVIGAIIAATAVISLFIVTDFVDC